MEMTNQMKMIDDRVDYHKCAWYHGYREHTVCGYYGYDECNEAQAQNCSEFIELKQKKK